MAIELTFNIPNKVVFQRLNYQYGYESVTTVKSRTKFLCSLIKDDKLIIKWNTEDTNLKHSLNSTGRKIKSANLKPSKSDLLQLFCAFLSDSDNLIKLAEHFGTAETNKLAELLCAAGYLGVDTIYSRLRWAVPQRGWFGLMREEDIIKWRTDSDTAPIAPMTYLFEGPKDLSQSYYYTKAVYFGVFPSLIRYYLEYVRKVALTELADTEGLTLFDGTDVLGQEQVLQQLLIAGKLNLGKNKLTKSGLKVAGEMTKLAPFPEEKEGSCTRLGLLLNALYNIYVDEDMQYQQPTVVLQSPELFKKMAAGLLDPLPRDITCFIGEDVKINATLFRNQYHNDFEQLALEIFDRLKQISLTMYGKWVEMQSFIDTLTLELARKNVGYFLPDQVNTERSLARYASGNFISPENYKRLIHDRIIEGYILSLSSIGYLKLLFDDNGQAVGLQPTALADWKNNLTAKFPESKAQDNTEIFRIDSRTRIVTVKEPTHPYASIIAEFAEKLGNNRYVITEGSLLKGCNTSNDLEAKINRYKTFIDPSPEGEIKAMFDYLRARTTAVQRTAGGSTYHLFDLDPKDKSLLQLVANNEDIRQYTLKVEGCRLLIKNSFIEKFSKILRDHGYLTDL